MKKILIVDDEIEIGKVLEEYLQKKGYEVTRVNTGEKALQTISSGKVPDLVIQDIKMPGMDGVEVARQVRKGYPDVSFLFLTGSIGGEKFRNYLRPMGYPEEDILYKPVDLEHLLESIRRKTG
jgi:CheY-like chemotaxis protein